MDPAELRARTERFAVDVSQFCDTLSKDARAQTPKLFFSKLCVVVEEIDEAQGWLEMLIASRRAEGAQARRLHAESTELVKIFTASKRTWLRNNSSG